MNFHQTIINHLIYMLSNKAKLPLTLDIYYFITICSRDKREKLLQTNKKAI